MRFSAIQATCDTRSVAREFEIPAADDRIEQE